MTKKNDDRQAFEERRTVAEAALAALEAVALGEAIDDASDRASEAIAEYSDLAYGRLFGGFMLWSADLAATYAFAEQSWTWPNYISAVAELHATLGPELGKPLRSDLMLERIRSLARSQAAVHGREPNEYATAEEDRYVRLVACSLLDHPEHGAAATLLAQDAPALRARRAACLAKHAEHRAAELARVEREQREVDEARARLDQEHRNEVARFFMARMQQRFLFRGSLLLSGRTLADAVAGDRLIRDEVQGYTITPSPTLEELEALMARTLAAEAVTVS